MDTHAVVTVPRWSAWAAALLIGALLPATSCMNEPGADSRDSHVELTRRQKDSLVAEMPIPGAAGVGRALEALDATKARADAHDNMR